MVRPVAEFEVSPRKLAETDSGQISHRNPTGAAVQKAES
jgi:hypothetical protein